MLLESFIILANEFPSSPTIRFIIRSFTGDSDLHVMPILTTPAFAVGALFAIAGSAFRLACYRALGRHFTYELSLQNGHRLVTVFPYNIVRHPSYTGILAAMGGAHLALLGGNGGIFRQAISSSTQTWGWLPLVVIGLGAQVGAIAALLARTSREDTMMKATFGQEWEEWAGRVRYRLVPGIY
jgi:protein-S-isoprenylcysteine O-methyltransferase Ste14